MKMMKKGQQEIMGLAIVILLIILAVLVIAKLSPNKEFYFKKEYEQSELASGMLNALLTTTTRDCNWLSIGDILQDCAVNNGNKCNGQNSCSYFEQQSGEIFGNTLDLWKINYKFSAFYNEESPIIELGRQCINKKSEMSLLPTKTGVLSVKLDICR